LCKPRTVSISAARTHAHTQALNMQLHIKSKPHDLTSPLPHPENYHVTCCDFQKATCLARYSLQRPPLWSSGQSSWLQYGDVLCFL
jgi:hypothetical protein